MSLQFDYPLIARLSLIIKEKVYFLTENSVYVIYKITNTGNFAFSCFYTLHCLVNNIKDVHLLIPKGINKVLMNDKPISLKELDDVVFFFITEKGVDLTDFSQLEDNQAASIMQWIQ